MDKNVLKKKTKKTRGQRIEKKEDLEVTFDQRREDLFRKASDLSVKTGAQIGILIRSPADKNKIFAFGSPSIEYVIDRFVGEGESASCSSDGQIVKQLEGRTKNEEVKTQEGREWWDKPFENMDLEELEQYAQQLEDFKRKGESASCSSNRQIVKQFEGSTKNEEVKKQEGREWWDKPFENMDLEELEQYAQQLEDFKRKGESASCSSNRQIVKQLEGSTKNEEVKKQEGREWWDKPFENMDLEELEQYAQQLEDYAADLGSD